MSNVEKTIDLTKQAAQFNEEILKTARNKNILVIGGSGSGKTRFFVKPNIDEVKPLELDYSVDSEVNDDE